MMGPAARFVNRLGGNFRWQHLPVPFEVYADGIDLVIFEEFGSGAAALHLRGRGGAQRDAARRGVPSAVPQGLREQVRGAGMAPRLLRRRDRRLPGRIRDRQVVRSGGRDRGGCTPSTRSSIWCSSTARRCAGAPPSPTTARRCSGSWPATPASRWVSPTPALTFATWRSTTWGCGCCATSGTPSTPGDPFMTIEQAVHRLTGELADWYRLDAGHLRVGDRADVVIIDPARLDASWTRYAEEPVDAVRRPVPDGESQRRHRDCGARRRPGGVPRGRPTGLVGRQRTGRFLRAAHKRAGAAAPTKGELRHSVS